MTRLVIIPLLAMAVIGASSPTPRALAGVSGGLWEVAKSANGHDAQRRCIADPATLLQREHRGGRCRAQVISDAGGHAVVRYQCADGSYGQSDLRVLTPRSLRIATQGISNHYPFNYTLHARRIGTCHER